MLNWYRAPRPNLRASFPKIEIPTLMIWGTEDDALSIRTTRGTDAYVANLTLRLLPGVSHWVQQEAPEAVNAILTEWLLNPRPHGTGL